MDIHMKQRALSEAVDLTGRAIASTTGNLCVLMNGEQVAEFTEIVYRKLLELHQDSMSAN